MTPADLQNPERGSAPVADDHPDAGLLALWQEWARLTDRLNNSSPSDDESNVLSGQASRIEVQMCDTTPRTPAGLVVLVKLLARFQEIDPTFTDGRDGILARNILAAVERFTLGLADVERGSSAAKPDPVVSLFAEWGTLQDEAAALGGAPPEAVDPLQKERDELYDRQSEIERQIIDTPATSVGGVAVKLRLLAYIEFPMKGLPDLHRTPAKDTDFEGTIEAWRADVVPDKGLDWQDKLLIGSLRDAERLAGAS